MKGKLFFVLIIILATVFCLFGCDSFGNDKLEDKIYKITVSNPEHAKIFIQTEDIGDSWVTELEVKRGTRINIKSECDEGWECVDYSLSNGENIYAQGFFIATGDAVLTADSRLITYSINYKIGGADINPNEQTEYTYFDSILKLETPTKYGADFIGWKINGEGDYVTEVDLSQIRNDFSIIAYWNEYFNLEYHGAGNYFDCYEITSLTEYGASKTEIYVPDTYNGKNIVAIGGLKNISIVTLMLEDLYIGANIKHIDDEVYENVSNIHLTEESSYFYEQGNFFLSNSSILFINEGYFANGNDALYIDDEISDVEAFGQKNIDLIKRFYVSNTHPTMRVEQTEKYVSAQITEGYSDGNVLIKRDILRKVISYGEKRYDLPYGIREVGQYALMNNNDIEEFYFVGRTAEVIAKKAFYGCYRLRRVSATNSENLPATIRVVDDYAFAMCSNLHYLMGVGIEKYGNYFIAETKIIEFTISAQVERKYIDMLAFHSNSLLQIDNSNTHFELSYEYVGYRNVLNNPNISEYPGTNKILYVDDFVFYMDIDEDDITYYLVSYRGTDEVIYLPSNTEFSYIIARNFLRKNAYVKKVFIEKGTPDSKILEIEEGAFSSCYELEEIMVNAVGTKFPEGDIIVNCPNLTKIYLYNYGTLPNVPVPESLLSYENVEIMQMAYDKNSPVGENAKWYYGYDGKICIIPKAE